jgi:hypothetical protein
VKEMTLPDSVDGSYVDTKEVIAEEKSSASTEKRKLQGLYLSPALPFSSLVYHRNICRVLLCLGIFFFVCKSAHTCALNISHLE